MIEDFGIFLRLLKDLLRRFLYCGHKMAKCFTFQEVCINPVVHYWEDISNVTLYFTNVITRKCSK